MILGIPLWFLMALSAAVIWGLAYTIDGYILEKGISPINIMLAHVIIVLPFYLIISFMQGHFFGEVSIVLSDKSLFGLLF